MDWTSDTLSVLLLAAGTGSAVMAKKRRFDRRGIHGIERYASFWAKLAGRSGDLALVAIAIFCIGLGSILLSFNHLDTWGWVVIAPLCLFMLYLLLDL